MKREAHATELPAKAQNLGQNPLTSRWDSSLEKYFKMQQNRPKKGVPRRSVLCNCIWVSCLLYFMKFKMLLTMHYQDPPWCPRKELHYVCVTSCTSFLQPSSLNFCPTTPHFVEFHNQPDLPRKAKANLAGILCAPSLHVLLWNDTITLESGSLSLYTIGSYLTEFTSNSNLEVFPHTQFKLRLIWLRAICD